MFVYTRRIQFYETDAQGVVHHSNYFRYLEEARGELLRSVGMPYSEIRKLGYEVVLIEAFCRYRRPAFYDQKIDIHIRVKEVNRFEFSFEYHILAEGQKLAEAYTKHCLVFEGKIVSLPKELRSKLDGLAGS
ncbi:acyl-CoA thioesterase [Thermocrinis minervae]|uniref:Acyl-CoA thioester hydrolase n=1 Tax=Thermocrinis minervae TaxID=381751 RepID=A0A1M6QEK2_9AQUI|nr:thioesterase family protein [Thermocrinis minervae]SHK18626.1 acyl-CoA thioester hydrolase [Thermocrinis minervae]